jgi:predicted nucleic acid-binding protein
VAVLLIAATAAANGLPLYKRNPSDFVGFDKVLKVIGL